MADPIAPAGSRLVLLLVPLLALAGCGRSKTETTAPEPTAAVEDEDALDEGGPEHEANTYVSTSFNEQTGMDAATREAEGMVLPEGDFAVTTPAAAKELAEAAVAESLDPKKTWTLSPVLPKSWPSNEPAVVVFFYPMAPNPSRLTEYLLFTPAFRVTVVLTDGTTSVEKLGKRKSLGTINETRPSSLERRELELAEAALVYQVLGADLRSKENPYWGYRKYVHEHPKLGRDLSRRSAAFFGWIEGKRR